MSEKFTLNSSVDRSRNLNVESLRVLMMLLIIILHMSGEYFNIKSLYDYNGDITVSMIFALRQLCFLGVSTFAFVSGFYGISQGGRKFIKYEMFAFSWCIIMLAVDIIIKGSFVSFKEVIYLLMPISSNICWYFSAYMLLLIFSPVLSAGIHNLSKRNFQFLLFLIFIVGYCGSFIFNRDGTSFLLILYIYVIGQYIRNYPIRILLEKSKTLFLFSTFLNVSIAFFLSYLGYGKVIKIWANNYNPLLILQAASLFIWAANSNKFTPPVKLLSKFAPYMFGVYVCHVYLLYLDLINFRNYLFISPIVSVLISALSILLMSICVEILRKRLFGGLINYITNLTSVKFGF